MDCFFRRGLIGCEVLSIYLIFYINKISKFRLWLNFQNILYFNGCFLSLPSRSYESSHKILNFQVMEWMKILISLFYFMNGPMFFLLVQKTAGWKHDLQKYNFVFFRQFKQDLLLFITLLQFQHWVLVNFCIFRIIRNPTNWKI